MACMIFQDFCNVSFLIPGTDYHCKGRIHQSTDLQVAMLKEEALRRSTFWYSDQHVSIQTLETCYKKHSVSVPRWKGLLDSLGWEKYEEWDLILVFPPGRHQRNRTELWQVLGWLKNLRHQKAMWMFHLLLKNPWGLRMEPKVQTIKSIIQLKIKFTPR